MSDVASEVAAGLIADDAAEAATDEVVEQTSPEEAAPLELPAWDADIDGIEDLLRPEDPDEFTITVDPDEVVVDEYTDPDVAKLQAELSKARKQLRYQQELRVQEQAKTWRAEGARRFPLADVDEIEATSRRAFLRKAQEQHDRYQRKLEPVLSSIEELKGIAITEGKKEAREQAAAAFGKPTTGPTETAIQHATESEQLDRSKVKGPYEMALARLKSGFQI